MARYPLPHHRENRKRQTLDSQLVNYLFSSSNVLSLGYLIGFQLVRLIILLYIVYLCVDYRHIHDLFLYLFDAKNVYNLFSLFGLYSCQNWAFLG